MFDLLSPPQREIVFDKAGKFVVRACPGSGKTFCVSARLARLVNEWGSSFQGIAALSFTNVAWQEIEKKYVDLFLANAPIAHPHFLGTIDSFVNRYIFLPFGHLVLGCGGRPVLAGQPHGAWRGNSEGDSQFENLTFDINGDWIILNPRDMPPHEKFREWARNSKSGRLRQGFATQQDANYFALKLLIKFPSLAQTLARRFSFLIVDEAQDTSAIQMAIIDHLIQNGLNEVMLVGDPDQAIFEWNNARPDLLNQKCHEWPDSVLLNENRRSSQNICNATFKLSSLGEASNAVYEKVKDHEAVPSVKTYGDDIQSLIDEFLATCAMHGIPINHENVALLFRSKNLLNKLVGIEPMIRTPWRCLITRDLAKGRFLHDNGDFKRGFELIEKGILKMRSPGSSTCSQEMIEEAIKMKGFPQHRNEIRGILESFPSSDKTFGEWVVGTNEILYESGINYVCAATKNGKTVTLTQAFNQERDHSLDYPYRLGTVHSVKGETFDATLLLLGQRGADAKYYRTELNNGTRIADSEELRIAYVGMTRPRKLLMIGVPNDADSEAWTKALGLVA